MTPSLLLLSLSLSLSLCLVVPPLPCAPHADDDAPGLRYATLWSACDTGFDAEAAAAAMFPSPLGEIEEQRAEDGQLADTSTSNATPSSSISSAEEAADAVRDAADALDASLFGGEGACESTGRYLRRAVKAAAGVARARGRRSPAMSQRRAAVCLQVTRVLVLGFCLAAVVQTTLAGTMLFSACARARLDKPRLIVVAITATEVRDDAFVDRRFQR